MSRNKKSSVFKFLVKIIVIVLLVFILFMFSSVYFSNLIFPVVTGYSTEALGDMDRVNLVLLGFDRNEARDKGNTLFRPAVILVASIDMRRAQVSMVSIPRDSYVKIHGRDTYDKINHSYMYGYYGAAENEDPDLSGIKTTLLTVQDFLGGVPLHGYLAVDMDGAAEIIDAVGGVYLDVPEDIRSNYGRGSVQITKGYQLLNGKQILQYSRNRADYLGGERGRTFRQQEVLIALFKKMASIEGLPKMPHLINAVKANIKTDLTMPRLSALGILGLRIDRQEIISRVFGGEGKLSSTSGQNIYYLVVDQENRIKIIEEVFGITVGRQSIPELPGPIVEEPEFVPEIEVEPEPETLPEPDPVEEPIHEPEGEIEPENGLEPEPLPDPDPEPDLGEENVPDNEINEENNDS